MSIGIARVLDLPNAFAVFASGMERPGTSLPYGEMTTVSDPGNAVSFTWKPQATGFREAVAAFSFVDQPFDVQRDDYHENLLAAIQKHTDPKKRATLFLFGHSLAGMVMQNMVASLAKLGYDVRIVVTFGSPITLANRVPGTKYVHFMIDGDLIPLISPMGPSASVSAQIWVPYSSSVSGKKSHGAYPFNKFLERLDPFGVYLPDPNAKPLRIGPITPYDCTF